MIPNGWRKNREWHNAHFFRSGKSLCGLDNPGGATKDVGGKSACPRCSKCRDEYMGHLHLLNPQAKTVLDMIDAETGPPMP